MSMPKSDYRSVYTPYYKGWTMVFDKCSIWASCDTQTRRIRVCRDTMPYKDAVIKFRNVVDAAIA